MQSAKNAAASVKEAAANVGASAKSGKDKTKATVQEKVEKMTSRDPLKKDMATQKKEEKIHQAELNKQEVRKHNAASKQAAAATGGTQSYMATGAHQVHGHATGQPTGHVSEGGVGSQYPLGSNTGSGWNPGKEARGGVGTSPGYGTGQPTSCVSQGSHYPIGSNTGSGWNPGQGARDGVGTGPDYGTGQPTGHVTEDVVGSQYPLHGGVGTGSGYGTGGT